MKRRPPHVKPKPTPREQLLVARARLRAVAQVLRSLPARAEPAPAVSERPAGAEARYVQCWTVARGYSGVTQALDEDGVVWERHSRIEKVDGASRLIESWWEPLDMTRRKPVPLEPGKESGA